MKLLSYKMIPNYFTMSRIVLIFVFVVLANIRSDMQGFFIPRVSDCVAEVCHIVAYIVVILAALTDFFDGFLARKFHLESDFGRLMDPLADKIFVVGTFVTMAEYQMMPGWIIIVVLTREFMVTGLRMLATKKGVVISADKWGKLKTCLQMILLAVGGFSCPSKRTEPEFGMVIRFIIRISVVFPAPLGPSRPKIFPFGISTET